MNEEIKKFYDLMSTDEALQTEAEKIFEEIEARNLPVNERNDAYDSKIFELAKKKGFNFSAADAKAYIEKLSANFGELSDSDLDQVAGGTSVKRSSISPVVAYGVFPNTFKDLGRFTI